MWSAAMDLGGWLRGLGLGQYEDRFRDNRIDADVLPRLTADDLKDIGVTAVGDRRRLLDAIAALAGATPAGAPGPSAPPKSPGIAAARLQNIAEANSILVGERTFRLLGRQFAFSDLGEQRLKGFRRRSGSGGSTPNDRRRAGSKRCAMADLAHLSGETTRWVFCCSGGTKRRTANANSR
jgi:hypothetical protein